MVVWANEDVMPVLPPDCERKGGRFNYSRPSKMPYDLEESKSGDMIYAESWAGGIA